MRRTGTSKSSPRKNTASNGLDVSSSALTGHILESFGAACMVINDQHQIQHVLDPAGILDFCGGAASLSGKQVTDLDPKVTSTTLVRSLAECRAAGKPVSLTMNSGILGDQSGALPVKITCLPIDGKDTLVTVAQVDGAGEVSKRPEHASHQFLEPAFESAPLLVYEYDQQMRLVRWNKQAEVLTGYSAAEMYHRPVLAWFDEDEIPKIVDGLSRMAKTGYATVEANLVTKDGRRVPYFLTGLRLTGGGRESFTGIGLDLTELRLAEQALRESEARFRTLVENSPMPIAIDRDGAVVYCNSKYLELFGAVRPAQIVGSKVVDQFAQHDRARVSGFIDSRSKGLEAPGEYEATGLKLDGTTFPGYFRVTKVEMADGPVTIVFVSDTTSRKQAQEALQTMNETLVVEREILKNTRTTLEATLNALPDLLFEVDSNFVIREYRTPTPEARYFPTEHVLGKTIREVIPEEPAEAIGEAIREAAKRGIKRGTVYSIEMGGESRWFELSLSRKASRDSGPQVFVALVRDITARRRAEIALEHLNEQLELERTALKQKNVALQELMAQVGESQQVLASHVQANIRSVIVPLLHRLKDRTDVPGRYLLAVTEEHLKDITSPFVKIVESKHRRLTNHELELCDLIRRGLGSREIATLRGCTVQTVLAQRKSLRKKLGIANKNINLESYLVTIKDRTRRGHVG